MSGTWACDDVTALAPLLIRLSRLSNEVMDHDGADPEDYATFREMGLRLVGRLDLTEAWRDLTECVAVLDAYLNDPGASDGELSEDTVRDDVDMALWCLLYPSAAPCWMCRMTFGGRDETPAMVNWAPSGECAHHDEDVTLDPWSVAA
jgi:hypothetical protein